MITFREAKLADATLCAQIIDAQEKSFDPDAQSIGEMHARELLTGYFSEVSSELLLQDGLPIAFINIHGDDVRETYFPDIYVKPPFNVFESALKRLNSYTEAKNPNWQVLIGINARDDFAKQILKGNNFQFVRKYWGMSAPISDNRYPELPAGLAIRKVDFESNSDLLLWYEAHQDAFSSHFGFKPRPFAKWHELVLSGEGLDKAGTFLLLQNNRCIGFIESSNEKAHESSGYINMVGVVKANQGMRFGTLLMKWGMAYAATRGFNKIGLNVDTGNSTSALSVYHRLGFVEISSWEQFKKII